MSDDMQSIESQGTEVAVTAPANAVSTRDMLRPLMSVRLGRSHTALCAETAWVWQRARLVCGQGE